MNRPLREQALAWALLAPALTVLGVFGIFPIGYAFFVSLHRWRIKPEAFVGFSHYGRALGDGSHVLLFALGAALLWALVCGHRRWRGARFGPWGAAAAGLAMLAWGLDGLLELGDQRLFNGFKVTAFYALGTIPLEVGGALILATLLFRALRGKGFFRVLYFLPYVTPMIATAVVFRTLFAAHPSSLANRFWGLLGWEGQRWLYESRSVVALVLEGLGISQYPAWVDGAFPSLALVSIVLYNIWVYIGYDTVILLAGLSAIPSHYFEAAKIDGASAAQTFRHITLPLISPSLFFLSLVAVIGTFKAFNHIYIMRTAGAQDTVDVVSVLIFDRFYEYHNAGYASALALILFVVILALTVVQNRLLGRRVFYGE
ncbi:carbohydrate ABC transporter permease [Candidatus Latescibacterota bacterium]